MNKTVKILDDKNLVNFSNVFEGMVDSDSDLDFANISSKDVAIPFLRILQDLSPQVKSGPAQVPGAKAGALYNPTTERMWTEPVDFIPCALKKVYVEWIPRTAGGGFVAAHETDKEFLTAQRAEKAFILPNGHEIIPTMLHYGLLCPKDEVPLSVIIPLNRTQLKKSRQWVSLMALQTINVSGRLKRPRIYSYQYTLSSVLESKDNYTWFGWAIDKAPSLIKDAELFNMAKNFAALINEGKASVKFDDAAIGGDSSLDMKTEEAILA